jgi:hypothetical protein
MMKDISVGDIVISPLGQYGFVSNCDKERSIMLVIFFGDPTYKAYEYYTLKCWKKVE